MCKYKGTWPSHGDTTWWNLENPPGGWIKCNVDAKKLSEEKKCAWGVVTVTIVETFSFQLGMLLIIGNQRFAFLEGLKLALANYTSSVITETDSASILEWFWEDSSDRSEVCLIAKEFNLLKPPDRRWNTVSLRFWILETTLPSCSEKNTH